MFVVMVAAKCAPAAQAGGLGQVVFGLSRELELRGHAVEIILPKYDCMQACDSRSALLVLVISRISRWALMSWRAGEEQLAGLVAELLHLGEQVA